ncbi:carboxypeptidase regulatory-like domain-containing protein [Roseiconus sp. JC912]|uniref:carboxypeptidase regulatory-like domain-containing protein n=1 Tax=Roseiconus sp. JC912 TaxID=3396307 RepID=UPI003A4C81FF
MSIEIPSVTTVSNTYGDVYWRVTGSGSVLSFPNLTSVNNGTGRNWDTFLESLQGGKLDLGRVTEIIDPNSGDLRQRSVQVKAEGVDSEVDLSSLQNFVDYAGSATSDSDGEYSRLHATQGGTIALGNHLTTRGIYIPIELQSRLLVGTLELSSSSLLNGSGSIVGNLINRSMVNTNSLSIEGSYYQVGGSLEIGFDGNSENSLQSRVVVSDHAELSGALSISEDGFNPEILFDYPLIQAASIVGKFDSVSGHQTFDPSIEIIYGTSVVVASQLFDRTPINTFLESNSEMGRRVFFDSLQTLEGNAEFRVVAPSGDLVFVSNTIPNNPDIGDFGPFRLNEVGSYEVQVFAHPDDNAIVTYDLVDAPVKSFDLSVNRVNSGQLSNPGELDLWHFNVDKASIYEMEASQIIGQGAVWFRVVNPSGRVVFETTEVTGAAARMRHTFDLSEPGEYTIEVLGRGDSTASYQFLLYGPESPRIVSNAVRGSDDESINSIWLFFNQPMDTSDGNFDLATDLLSLETPDGALAATGTRWENDGTLVVSFAEQTADTPIIISLSPGIFSLSGVPLDQDADGNAGEDPDDIYVATIRNDTIGPNIFLTDPDATASAPIEQITLYFSEPIDTSTFSQDDILRFDGPGGSLLNQIEGVLVVDDHVKIIFEQQIESGDYSISIGTSVFDPAGNALDQNQNGVSGEAEDIFTTTIRLTSPDLTVTSIANPTAATYGDEISLTWTVTNEGSDPAEGLWWDYVYLSADETWDLDDALVARVPYDAASEGAVAAEGGTYDGSVTAALPAVLPGNYHVIVRTNLLSTIAESDMTDNVLASSDAALFDLPELVDATPATVDVDYRDSLYYKFEIPEFAQGGSVLLRFGTDDTTVANELYLRRGAMPSAADYDERSRQGLSSNQYIILTNPEPGPWYAFAEVSPHISRLGELGTATTQVEFLVPGEFSVVDTSFGQGGTAGNRTIEINGANFDQTLNVSLSQNGTTIAHAMNYYRPGPEQLFATFDLRQMIPGDYDVVLTNISARSETIANGFQVVAGGGYTNQPTLTYPPAFRRVFHKPYVHFPMIVSWVNEGLNDAPIPLIHVASNEPFHRDLQAALADKGVFAETLFGFSKVGPPGILLPGESGELQLFVVPRLQGATELGENANYYVDNLLKNIDASFDFEAYRIVSRQRGLSDSENDALFNNFSADQRANPTAFQIALTEAIGNHSNDSVDGIGILQSAVADLFAAYAAGFGQSLVGAIEEIPYQSLRLGDVVVATNVETNATHASSIHSDGRFVFSRLPVGNYFLTTPRHLPLESPVAIVIEPNRTTEVTLQIAASASVSGSLTTAESSTAIAGVQVRLLNEDRAFTTETDASGGFVFSIVPIGNYKLMFESAGWQSVQKEILLGQPGVDSINNDLTSLPAPLVIGRVIDSDTGAGIAGAVVLGSDGLGHSASTLSSADGTFQLSGMPAGTWTLDVTSQGKVRETAITEAAVGNQILGEITLREGAQVDGIVKNSSGEAVPDVQIKATEVNGDTYFANVDSSGRFSLDQLPGGRYDIGIESNQFVSASKATVDVLAGVNQTGIEVIAGAAGHLQGHIFDANGQPLSNVEVRLVGNRYGNHAIQLTDDQGLYVFDRLLWDVYSVTAIFESRLSVTQSVDLRVTTDQLLDLAIPATFTIEGTVWDATETFGIPAAKIQLYDVVNNIVAIQETTQDGSFLVAGIPNGSYTLVASADGRLFKPENVEVLDGNITQPLVAYSGSVTGRITDLSGAPVIGVGVELIVPTTGSLGLIRSRVRSDDSGSYTIEGVPAGDFSIRAVDDQIGSITRSFNAVANSSTIADLQFEEMIALAGDVKDSSGDALSDVLVVISLHDSLDDSYRLTRSDADGQFALAGISPGVYDVVLVKDGFEIQLRQLDLNSSSNLQFVLAEAAATVFRVVDSQTGLPLDQVSVYFSLNGIPIGNALQNESGVLSFPSSGGWQLVALLRSGESISTQTIALPAGQEVNLESFGCSNGCAVLGSQGSAATSVMNVALSQAEGESSDGLNDIIQFAPNRIDDNRGRIEEYRRARDYIQNQFQANLPSITPIPGLPSLPGPPPAICDKDGKLLAEFRKLESTFQELIQQRDDLIKQKQFLDQTETHLRSSADNALKRAEDAIRSATTDNYEVEAKVIFLAAVGYAYGGIGSLVALILGLIDATVENIDKANGNLSVYEFSLNEVVRIRKEFNAKIPAFEDRIRQFQKDVEQYLENVRDADCSLPNLEPISDGGCINDGPFTGDVLDTKDLATLRGLVWHIRRQNTRGFSIDGKGKYRYAPEDCGSDSFTYELVIIATGVNGPETYVLSGTISFVVTDDCIDPPDPGPCQSVEQDCDEFTYTTMNCGAVDPNDIIGPIGAGEQRWIPKKELLNYIVRFENDAEKATAPAARVTIRQQLDSDLDFSTFKLGQFGFGGTVFSNATGQSSYQSRIDYTDSLGIYLDVSSSIDISTGELLFQFTSIDPETGAVPFNPLLGFLPPNVSGSEGEGFISYSIKPKTGVASGTKIDAVAEIIFDQNEAIDTPPIYNTIDAEIPGSAVMDLPSEAYPGVLVQWAGDDLNGSGISLYDVYVSRNGEQFERWLTRTSLTEAPFYAGIPGSTYSFYSVATDYVGYRETPPTVTDAITTILEPARVSQISVANDRRSLDVQFTQDMDIDGLIQSGAINETIGIETFDGSAFDLDGAQYQYDQASQTLSIELTTAIPEGTYRLSLDAVALTNDAGGQLASGISGTTFAASDFETPSNLIVSGSPLTYTGSLGPQWIDFNTDGLQDLLVVNEDAEGNHALELYLNSGNSSSPLFDDPIMVEGDEGEFQLPAQATSMPIFHDWNGDGETDLLVALDDGRIERWTNVNTNEQPILSRPQLLTYETGQGPAEIVLFASAISMIDINSDGRPDLVVGMQDGSVVAFMDQSQRGAPSFAIPQLIMVRDQTLVATSVSNLGTGDLNHDGKSDLLITSNDGHLLFYPNVGSNAMRFLGGWDISAEAFAGLPAGTSVSSATFGDINGDGRTDLLVSSNDGIVHQILALGETTSLARTSLIEADPTQYIEEFVVKESMVPIWTNPLEPHDVDDMNGVTTTDALIVINYIARVPDGRLPSEETVPHFYYDVNGDEVVSPIDALRVLNFLAIHGSGEQEHLVRKPAAVTLKTERETLLITDEALTEDTFDVGSAVEPAAENLSWSVEVDEMFAGDLFRLNEVSLLQKEKTEEIVREFEVLKLF